MAFYKLQFHSFYPKLWLLELFLSTQFHCFCFKSVYITNSEYISCSAWESKFAILHIFMRSLIYKKLHPFQKFQHLWRLKSLYLSGLIQQSNAIDYLGNQTVRKVVQASQISLAKLPYFSNMGVSD